MKPFPDQSVPTLITDLTNSGEVFNALSQHFGFEGLETGEGVPKVDAVVHFAAVPRILIHRITRHFRPMPFPPTCH